ncbi:MAG TPA: hypothetical protein VF006_15700 [Longimicrobium sp.]
MRTHPAPLRRALAAFALAGASLGLAPAGAAQELVPHVGNRIPYRVELPAMAQISEDGASFRARSGDLLVVLAVGDVGEFRVARSLPEFRRGMDAEARRALTDVIVSSDALLLGMLDESLSGVALSDVAKEVRMLGGQRAGYLRGRMRCDCGHMPLVETHVTVKDGIVYALTVAGAGDNPESHEPLMARVHESFVLPR